MRAFLYLVASCLATPAFAAPVAVDSPRWRIEGAEARVEEHQGQQALYLRGAIARLMDANVDTGVIEFDMLLPSSSQSVPGVLFRGQEHRPKCL